MEKWLCWGSMGIAGVLMILFILDAAIKIPFGGISFLVDICGALAGAILVFLGWEAFRENR